MKTLTFNENDIRPQQLMGEARKLALIDAGRMLTRRNDFVCVDCPACGSNKSQKKFEKVGFNYVECSGCETMYINPRPSREVLDWFYRGSVFYPYWNTYIFPASESVRREKIFVPRVERVLKFCDTYQVKTDSLLEIGAAFGMFCLEMKSRNRFRRIVGVEPTPDLAQTCKEKGIDIIENLMEDIVVQDDERYDVVANFEVIEHTFSPREFIMQCRSFLKPGGLFVATCPNGKGFDFITLGSLCSNVDHQHLNYFNPGSFSLLLKSCGFEILEVLTPGKLDAELVRNRILSGEYDISHNIFLKQVLVDKWADLGESFQEFLSGSGLSSSMWMVARKW
ncbi:MAG: class I SAM-dependent methyltransferase [Candidatus Brocadia sp.]|nr:Ubiquinone biosynthesis O-methyltransferase [Candidatus Brocadia fulgida]MCC6326706.1 class I SAM-dependent methyltransferase [Candidatus Brocadia sp.]MCE7911321.1 class I SAM-dependent methyltransferase [Candidatus Brocadia sp. AMX3]MDG5996228.1 class I SAM-dependent methyltransferase [Candidatus Brocadia sp.]RIK01951.1 MAG: class I SAM-dependent methyltransferase [Candidatus Brocadia sp.]